MESVKPNEPETDALAEGKVAIIPMVDIMSMRTNPRLTRCFAPLEGLRSLIIPSSHPCFKDSSL